MKNLNFINLLYSEKTTLRILLNNEYVHVLILSMGAFIAILCINHVLQRSKIIK